MVSAQDVKKLRDKTNMSVIECKKALDKSKGDFEKALNILNDLGKEKAAQKSERSANQGIIEAYIHSNCKVGVILQLFSETDFVANNQEFKNLAHDIAMHIAAVEVADKKDLLSQPFIKDPQKTIEDLINEHIAKLGENIQIGEFVRLKI